jgi:drug/metabolite transporter (DMT)-like permease
MLDSTLTLPKDPPAQAYAVLAMGVLAVSLAAILIRLAQAEGVPSLVIAAARLTIAALMLTPLLARRPHYRAQIAGLNARDLALAGISGFFLAAHFATWVSSLEYTSVLISVVLVTTTPIWVALLEVVFLRASITLLILLGIVISLAGGLLIGLSGDTSLATDGSARGALLSLAGAITVAVYLIIGRELRPRIGLIPYIWLVYSCGALTLIALAIVSGASLLGYRPEAYVLMALIGLIPQLIGHSSLNYALGYLPATYVSVATQAEPISSALMAYLLFQEQPTGGQIVGSLIILLGVLLATLGQSRRSE